MVRHQSRDPAAPALKSLIEHGQHILRVAGCPTTLKIRKMRGLKQVCDCLAQQPGADWQERWEALEHLVFQGASWISKYRVNSIAFGDGISFFMTLNLIKPSYRFLFLANKRTILYDEQSRKDYDYILKYAKEVDCIEQDFNTMKHAYGRIRIHTGKALTEFTLNDLYKFDAARKLYRSHEHSPFIDMCRLLIYMGVPIDQAAVAAERHSAMTWTPESLIAHHGAQSTWYEYPILSYLRERAASSNPESVRQAARHIIRDFLQRVLIFNPEQRSFDLSHSLARQWKNWATKLGTGEVRLALTHLLTDVRAFYSWLEMMGNQDPKGWGKYGAHNPVTAADFQAAGKNLKNHRAIMKSNTAAMLPYLANLRQEIWRNYVLKNSIVAWARSASEGEEAEFDGHVYGVKRNYALHSRKLLKFKAPRLTIFLTDQPSKLIYPTLKEDIAFWLWVSFEILLTTGMRPGELLSLQLADITSQDLEGEGIVPCLRIRASKTTRPRFVNITPHVLLIIDTIITRVRLSGREYPFVIRRNTSKRNYSPMSKLLIQRKLGLSREGLRTNSLASWMGALIMKSKEENKLPPHFHLVPREIRRIYATLLYRKGVSLLKISKNLGHSTLDMTRSYIIDEDDASIDPDVLELTFY